MSRQYRLWLVILLTAVVVRLITLGAYPLSDTTEARYAEIARLMVVSNDWITPQIDVDVPFWGKPPLSFWLTAGSFKLLGFSDFAARLPSLVLLLACVALVMCWSEQHRVNGLAAGAILMSMALGFISAGAVMTDPALVFATTLAMVGFWQAVMRQKRHWGYVFFIALALGLLAKGPIAWVLTLVPIGLWVIWQHQWSRFYKNLPWLSGLATLLLISAPWYLMAELKTPGFLSYFLIGEHWLRFVQSGWQGDLYGSAHAEPRGTIWLFWLFAALPWSLVTLKYAIHSGWRKSYKFALAQQQRYLLLWAMTPMVFFTFAGNILPAYVLPGLPAVALLLAEHLVKNQSRLAHLGWLVPVLIMVLGPSVIFQQVAQRSERDLIAYVAKKTELNQLIYFQNVPFSARYYSANQVRAATTTDAAMQLLETPRVDFIAVKAGDVNEIPQVFLEQLEVVAIFPRYVLLTTRD